MSESSALPGTALEVRWMPGPRGGRLRRGNPGNHGGRPRSVVRQRYLKATDENLEFLQDVIDGFERETYVTSGGVVVQAEAKLRDKIRAAEVIQRGAVLALAPEKPVAEKQRVLQVVVRREG